MGNNIIILPEDLVDKITVDAGVSSFSLAKSLL